MPNAELISYILLTTFLLLVLVNRNAVHPLFNLINRWVRWFLFANTLAFLFTSQDWTDRPYWVVFLTAFLGWFLIETIYNWIYIRALSFSEVPLFPRYKETDKAEWPIDGRWIEMKRWMREAGYKQVQALEAELVPEVFIRNIIFENPEGTLRVQVILMPQTSVRVHPYFILSSVDQDGQRILTNNLPLPFGGIYPREWNVARKPLVRHLEKLIALHNKRLEKKNFEPVPFEDDPLHELNRQQRALEQVNVQQGYLHPREYHEDYGVLSTQGRYRLWKEIWALNYLGRVIR